MLYKWKQKPLHIVKSEDPIVRHIALGMRIVYLSVQMLLFNVMKTIRKEINDL
jgi:hypothetical protein